MSLQPLDSLCEGYLDYLTGVSRKAPGTVRDVRCSLRRISREMEQIRPNVALWHLKLEDYLHWLEQERQLGTSAQSLAKFLSHVRGLLDYAWRSGRSNRNVLDGFTLSDSVSRHTPQSLTLEEAEQLVQACQMQTRVQRQERVMVLLLYGCGLRTEELCSLDVPDINRERQELLVRHGKGDRERVVPIPEAVFTALLAYLLERGGKRGPLFRTTAKKCRINGNHVRNAVRHAAERAQIKQLITPKMLRHSYATHLMDAGVDLAVIASLMGHRSPQETGVYLHVLEPKPREAVSKLNGKEGGGS